MFREERHLKWRAFFFFFSNDLPADAAAPASQFVTRANYDVAELQEWHLGGQLCGVLLGSDLRILLLKDQIGTKTRHNLGLQLVFTSGKVEGQGKRFEPGIAHICLKGSMM